MLIDEDRAVEGICLAFGLQLSMSVTVSVPQLVEGIQIGESDGGEGGLLWSEGDRLGAVWGSVGGEGDRDVSELVAELLDQWLAE